VIYLKKYQKEIKNNMDAKPNQNSIEDLTNDQKGILMAPVFIVGAGRSGTTWLQRLLLEHPHITGGQESEFFLYFSACLNAVKGDEKAQRELGLSVYWNERDFHERMISIWMQTFVSMLKQKPQAWLLSEKTPSHAMHMDLILEFLPNAKFIHIIRDSRAVVSSMVAAEKGWGKSWAASTAKGASITWWRSVRAAKESGGVMLDGKYLELHYEDLLADTKSELSKVYNYLGVEHNSKLVECIVNKQAIEKQKKSGGTGFKDYAGNELKEPEGFFRKGQSDSWKKDLTIFQKLTVWRYTRKLMRECGYNWSGRIKG